jgi:beta-lactamase class A
MLICRGVILNLLYISFIFVSTQCVAESTPFQNKLQALEANTDGRIGISIVDTNNQFHLGYRALERFPTGCTAKLIGVAALLKKSMHNPSLLNKRIYYSKKQLTNWTPITEKHVTTGMTLKELASAAISYSDNTAMNLVVKELGGLKQMNDFAKYIHNKSFRQDHGWPEEALSGGKNNIFDSATPADMQQSLLDLCLGNALANTQRQALLSWMKNTKTGDARIRAGVPKTWTVADKTGTGSNYGTTNDIGIIWPPHCKPIVIAVYYTSENKNAKKREDVLAKTTNILLRELALYDQCLNAALRLSS